MIRSRSGNGANARLHGVDREPLEVARAPSRTRRASLRHLLGHRRVAHQPVVGVDRDPEAQPAQHADRVLGDRRAHAGVDVRGRAQLEAGRAGRGRTTARRPSCSSPGGAGDVVDDAHTVTEPLGAAVLHRLPDRRQPERLAGVDGGVEVLAHHVLERVEVAGRAGSRPRRRRCRTRPRRGRASARPARRSRGCGPRCASPSRWRRS